MNKIVLIGAGSTNFGLGTIGYIFKSKVLTGCTIVLHDINDIAANNFCELQSSYQSWSKFHLLLNLLLSKGQVKQRDKYVLVFLLLPLQRLGVAR